MGKRILFQACPLRPASNGPSARRAASSTILRRDGDARKGLHNQLPFVSGIWTIATRLTSLVARRKVRTLIYKHRK